MISFAEQQCSIVDGNSEYATLVCAQLIGKAGMEGAASPPKQKKSASPPKQKKKKRIQPTLLSPAPRITLTVKNRSSSPMSDSDMDWEEQSTPASQKDVSAVRKALGVRSPRVMSPAPASASPKSSPMPKGPLDDCRRQLSHLAVHRFESLYSSTLEVFDQLAKHPNLQNLYDFAVTYNGVCKEYYGTRKCKPFMDTFGFDKGLMDMKMGMTAAEQAAMFLPEGNVVNAMDAGTGGFETYTTMLSTKSSLHKCINTHKKKPLSYFIGTIGAAVRDAKAGIPLVQDKDPRLIREGSGVPLEAMEQMYEGLILNFEAILSEVRVGIQPVKDKVFGRIADKARKAQKKAASEAKKDAAAQRKKEKAEKKAAKEAERALKAKLREEKKAAKEAAKALKAKQRADKEAAKALKAKQRALKKSS